MPNKEQFPIPSEHDIMTAMIRDLPTLGIYCWRNNAGKLPQEYTNKAGFTRKRFVNLGVAGLPDILGILGPRYPKHVGRLIAIEVKRPGGKTTTLQDLTLDTLRSFGALAFVAYSFDDILRELEALKR